MTKTFNNISNLKKSIIKTMIKYVLQIKYIMFYFYIFFFYYDYDEKLFD